VGVAARKREAKKLDHYKSCISEERGDKFVPFVFETFGHWGAQAHEFLRSLAERLTGEGSARPIAPSVLLGSWWKRLSVAMVRGNFQLVAAAASLAQNPHFYDGQGVDVLDAQLLREEPRLRGGGNR